MMSMSQGMMTTQKNKYAPLTMDQSEGFKFYLKNKTNYFEQQFFLIFTKSFIRKKYKCIICFGKTSVYLKFCSNAIHQANVRSLYQLIYYYNLLIMNYFEFMSE